MSTMDTGTIRMTTSLRGELEEAAKQMNTDGQNEREVDIHATSARVWLVRVGTKAAETRLNDKGSVLTDASLQVDGENFFLARR